MRTFLSIVLVLLLHFSVAAAVASRTDANLHGHVVDAETGEHLPYYLITLEGTGIVTTTDATGHYKLLNLKPGHYTVTASMTGYKMQQHTVDIAAGKSAELNFDVQPDAFMLDQVVVTGSKSETKRRNSPVLVSVVTDKVFGLVNACSLADGLSFQPGVRVENDCQNCGFTQVRINGLDGHYSQVLMNSRPVFSALAGVYGLEQIPANMIDRVEVMRGGGSALFGSSAIGGTINIITKDPHVNYAEVSHQLTSIGLTGALDNNTTLNASVVTDNNALGLTVYGQSRQRDGYDHDGDGFTEVPELSTKTLGARATMRPDVNSRLSLDWHGTQEYRRGGDNLDLPPHEAMVAEQVDHNINAGEISFDLWTNSRANHLNTFAALQNIKRRSYYGSGMDPNAYGRTHDFTFTAGAQWTQALRRLIFMPSELIGGIEYTHNYLHDVTTDYDHDYSQTVNIYSAYLQNEWRDDRWGLLIGARMDKHSLVSNPIVSPRLNIRFNPSDSYNFRLSYSTGFRAPQAFDEDFHIAIVGGERVVTVLAPGLKQESSNSVSGSADIYRRIGPVQCNLMLEGFFTDIRDVFALRELPAKDAAGNTVLERYNGDGARVAGANAELRLTYGRYSLQGGITWQRSRYKRPEQWSDDPDVAPVKRLFRTPDFYGYVTFSADITRRLSASLSGTYTGRMLVQHLAGSGTAADCAVETPRFFDASLKLNYTFNIFKYATFDASVGVMNIFDAYQRDFDQGPDRDSGYIYGPSLPRSLTASLKLHL